MRKFWTRSIRRGSTEKQQAISGLAASVGGREVRIGLDLGVANTRCIVNLLGATPGEDESFALALERDRACLPSTIAVVSDVMHIGTAAESMDGALRSVLMWLPLLAGDSIDTSVSGKYDNLKQTVFNFGDHMISAKEVMILYLERVLARVLRGLDQHIGAGRWHGSLRVPVPAVASRRYRALLEEVVTLALDLAMAANGRTPSMTESLSGLTERYQRGSGRAPQERCQVTIVSSAEAAAVALTAAASSKAQCRRVVAIDIGAGSTTATCFKRDRMTASLRGVHSVFNGMDDIDQLFARARAVRRKPARVFRESSGLRPSDRPMVRRGLDLLCAPMQEALGMATAGGRTLDRWCKGRRAAFDVVLIGGGGCCDLVRDEFKRRTRTPLPGAVEFWDVETAMPSRTSLLLCMEPSAGGTQQPIDPAELPLLVIAEGLAERSVSYVAGTRRKTKRHSSKQVAARKKRSGSSADRARDARFDVH